jgi:hypothetical protein
VDTVSPAAVTVPSIDLEINHDISLFCPEVSRTSSLDVGLLFYKTQTSNADLSINTKSTNLRK